MIELGIHTATLCCQAGTGTLLPRLVSCCGYFFSLAINNNCQRLCHNKRRNATASPRAENMAPRFGFMVIVWENRCWVKASCLAAAIKTNANMKSKWNPFNLANKTECQAVVDGLLSVIGSRSWTLCPQSSEFYTNLNKPKRCAKKQHKSCGLFGVLTFGM